MVFQLGIWIKYKKISAKSRKSRMEQKQNAPMAKKRQKRRGWQMPLNPRSSAPLGASSSLKEISWTQSNVQNKLPPTTF